MSNSTLRWLTTTFGLASLIACSGQVMDSRGGSPATSDTSAGGTGSGGKGAGSGSNTAGTGGTASNPGGKGGSTGPAAATGTGTAAMPLRLMTRTEYNNTVRDLLGDTSRPALQFPTETRGASGFFENTEVSGVEVDRYEDAAANLSVAAVRDAATLSSTAPCAAGAVESSCASQFIDQFGRRAFRRPVTTAEKGLLTDLYNTVRGDPLKYDFKGAVRVLVQAMLESPQFLYRWELGSAPATKDGDLIKLNPYEVASRLSYFLWRSMPDVALLDAAANGQLNTTDDIAKQATRMLADAKSKDTYADFHGQWLELQKLVGLPKDSTVFKDYSDDLATAMASESSKFLSESLFADGKFSTLLTGNFSYVNDKLAKLYGITGVTGSDLRRVDLPPERAGIFTQASFLTVHALPQEGSPIRRGHVIIERLLCQHLNPPPPPDDPNKAITPPPYNANASTRERYEAHVVDPYCKGCHNLIDPPGFAFESFDGIGKFRTTDGGKPVDASGKMTVDGVEKSYNNAKEMMTILADSNDVRSCLGKQWMSFALARDLDDSEADNAKNVFDAFAAGGFDVRKLMVAVAVNNSFTHRRLSAGEVTQ